MEKITEKYCMSVPCVYQIPKIKLIFYPHDMKYHCPICRLAYSIETLQKMIDQNNELINESGKYD